MGMKKEFAIAYLLAIVAGAGWAVGQDNGTMPDGTPSPSPTTSPDGMPTESPAVDPLQQLNSAVALNVIHHVNMGEIQGAQSAQGRLQRQDVQQYAEMLITDHQASETELQSVATSEDIELAGYQPSTFETAGEDILNGLPADQFDEGFLELQRQGHERALRDLQAIQPTVSDAEVQQQVSQNITLIQGHLDQANALIAGGAQPSPTASPGPEASPEPTESPTPSPSPTESPGMTGDGTDGGTFPGVPSAQG